MKRLAPLLFLLSACGSQPAPEADARIECAVDGAEQFARVCTLERTPGAELLLTVRSPSGSFRRLVAAGDGSSVTAADGAEPAQVEAAGDGVIEVSIGADRYRLPVPLR